jgi:hypothetical protein
MEFFEEFHMYEPDKAWVTVIDYPDDPILLGSAVAVGYRSNKWQENRSLFEDYSHLHEDPLPIVVMQRPTPSQANRDSYHHMLYERRGKPRYKKPKHPVFTVLGFALDVEYVDAETHATKSLDWSTATTNPLLMSDQSRSLFLIRYQSGGYPVILYSENMTVTAHGIER